MNFELSDDQRAIKETAREFLAARYGMEVVRELAAGERGFTDEQWLALVELGWPGVVAPDEHGGMGLGAVELIVIAEELGYALAPCPLLPDVWAGLLLEAGGSEEQRRRWLEPLAAGELRGTVALRTGGPGELPEPGGDGSAERTLTETWITVPDAASADFVIVGGEGGPHHLVETEAEGVGITAQPGLDPTRKLFELRLDGAPAEPLGGAGNGAVERAHGAIVSSLAAENVGIAQRTMEMAVEYARERKQFDRPIGVNQAVSHRCAQMLLETEGARSLAYGAAWALDNDPDGAARAASMAKAYAGDAGFRVAGSALQVLGGIGFTWEHDLHLFMRRAKANAQAFGDGAWHRERVAALSGLPRAAAAHA